MILCLAHAFSQGLTIDSLQNYRLIEDTSIPGDTTYFEKDFSGWDIMNKEEYEESEGVNKKEEILLKDTSLIRFYLGKKDGKSVIYQVEKETFDSNGNLIKKEIFGKEDFSLEFWKGFNFYSKMECVYDDSGKVIDELNSEGKQNNLDKDVKELIKDGVILNYSFYFRERTLTIYDNYGNVLEKLIGYDHDGDCCVDNIEYKLYTYDFNNVLIQGIIYTDMISNGISLDKKQVKKYR